MIDFLGTGGQAVCPPSVWTSADGGRTEPREWDGGEPGEPAVVPFPVLWDAVTRLAAACGAKAPDPSRSPRGTGGVPRKVGRRAVAYLNRVPGAVAGQAGHDQLFAAARALVWGFDLPVEEAVRLLADHYNPRCVPPWTDAELRHKCEEADRVPFDQPRGHLRDRPPPGPGAPTGPADTPDRPAVPIGPDEYRVNAEAVAGLAAEPDLYQRGRLLVHVVEASGPDAGAAVSRPPGVPVIRELPPALVRERLTRCVRLVKMRPKKEGVDIAPAHPPDWCMAAVHCRGEWAGVRHLEAVVTHPVLRADGSVLATDGYDPGSGLLVRLAPGLAVAVPDRPTVAEVAAADLLDVVAQFPFLTEAHRAAWVASLLTPLAWFGFDGPAPLFLADKNVPGAGAGLLVDTVALTLTGRRFPVMSYTGDREELRKRITSLAVEGERAVLLDNLAGPVGSDVFDAALTSVTWRDRLLG